jgi:hypothetical protein
VRFGHAAQIENLAHVLSQIVALWIDEAAR